MILSRSFLLGIGALAAADLALEPLSEPPEFGRLLATLLLLPVPVLTAQWTGRRMARAAIQGRPMAPLARLALRLESLTVPLAFSAMVFSAGLQDFALTTAPGSDGLRTAILLTPLLLLECGLRMVQARTSAWFSIRRMPSPFPLAGTWARGSVLLSGALVAAATLLDVTRLYRPLEVLISATYLGTTLSLLAAIAVLAAVLAPLLVLALATERRLPRDLDEQVRDICTRLDFPPSAVRLMRTGGRMVNAALVGPLRWPRYLLLTDGLVALLDPFALRGVVAHEVGHHRAHHPGLLLLLFVVVPVLAVHPLSLLEYPALDAPILWIGVAGLALIGWWTVRTVMHRMEFEADQQSNEALGGALHTIAALERVSELHGPQGDRAGFRHPSTRARIRALLAWDRDPGYRTRFLARGRALRRLLAVLLLAAAATNLWAHARTWDVDRVYLAFLTGDFRTASLALEELPEEAPGLAVGERAELLETISAARALSGDGGRWDDLMRDLPDRAWQRGLAMLLSQEPSTAAPWLGLATLGPRLDPVRLTAHSWILAIRDQDLEAANRYAERLRVLPDVPEPLRTAIAAAH